MRRKFVFSIVCSVFFLVAFSQKFNNLAPTPPMGWNSWNKFECKIDEKTVREIADAMVVSGMKAAGYEYINLDDCWQGERDSLGFITENKEKFPSGMKALADYIHAKGLKFGVYSCAGDKTCAGRAGSRGYEYQDALIYARWGVDFLKLDWCNTLNLNAQGAYQTMSEALKKAGRPIVFSTCEWGKNKPWVWGRNVAQMWRTTGDITNCFDCLDEHGGKFKTYGVMQILDMQQGLRNYAGPNCWNDMDMLEVGNGMPVNEQRAHFTMWCMMASPLIAGNDLRAMSSETLKILTNKELISINQDVLGVSSFKLSSVDSVETWVKPLSGDEWAICFLNRSLSPKLVSIDWNRFNLTDTLINRSLKISPTEVYQFSEVWGQIKTGDTRKKISKMLPSRDVYCFRLCKKL
ncbi:MAG: glycoside hydrolase family 27 protein [Bacteroidales bacterium]